MRGRNDRQAGRAYLLADQTKFTRRTPFRIPQHGQMRRASSSTACPAGRSLASDLAGWQNMPADRRKIKVAFCDINVDIVGGDQSLSLRRMMAADHFPTAPAWSIIGGGIIGCSVAYHLTKHGWRDVVLLEQGRLTCGTTWHAAGLVGQLRAHQNMTRLVQYSAELYQTARSRDRPGDRLEAMRLGARRAHAGARDAVQAHRLGGARAGRRLRDHLAEGGGREISRHAHRRSAGALWLPSDGKVNPADVTQALAKGARKGGARIFEQTPRHRDPSTQRRRDRRRDRRAATSRPRS